MKHYALIGKSLTIMLMAGMLAGCGSQPVTDDAGETETTESASTSEPQSGSASESGAEVAQTVAAAPSPADAMVGDWEFMCSIYHSEDEEGDYDYVNMKGDEYPPESEVRIRKDGDRFLMDYTCYEFESNEKIYGAEMDYYDRAAYRDAYNQDWCLEMHDTFLDVTEYDDFVPIRLSMKGDDVLVVSEEYLPDPSEEYSYYSVNSKLYLKKSDPRLDDAESLRYFDAVTVSNATDMLNSVQNNRKIILEGGTYDFSSIVDKEIDNKFVSHEYGQYSLSGVSNLCLEAEDGADVQFSIDDPYSPVFTIGSSSHVTLRGITAGHNVEPGYCSGSVFYFGDSEYVTVDKCSLYGSGTYGIEASYVGNVHVTDTDIHECTYGLIDLRNSGNASFENCKLRDSSDLTMINFYDGYELTFDNCEFSGNKSAYETCYFVSMGEYDRVTFRNCSFKNNQFFTFSNREVTMENCTYDNNYATFSDLIKSVGSEGGLSKDQILANYDDALRRQGEIDDKLNSDSLLDQLSLNQLAHEEYDLWDTLLNQIWGYMSETLDEGTMATVTEEQRVWIRDKEASMKEAASGFEGGSMQPMVEYGSGATTTRNRVEELLNRYVR